MGSQLEAPTCLSGFSHVPSLVSRPVQAIVERGGSVLDDFGGAYYFLEDRIFWGVNVLL